jgi:hypothetical protein
VPPLWKARRIAVTRLATERPLSAEPPATTSSTSVRTTMSATCGFDLGITRSAGTIARRLTGHGVGGGQVCALLERP